MNATLSGKVALVTAASQGLGKAIAAELSRGGAHVYICSRQQEAIERTAREISAETGRAVTPLVADVSTASEITPLFDRIAQEHSHLDVLVCNAGGPPGGTFEMFDDAAWQSAFETNLLSVVRLVRGALPFMKEAGGRIVTIASSSVKVPIPGLILSNTMRAGVAGLMKSLANELASYGILVNTVCPGRIATDRVAQLDGAKAEREGKSVRQVKESVESQIPLGRYGEPEEFARVVAFLSSDANTYMTGSTFFVDGGMVQAL
ncbi:SDR family oxidoreductase [Numidum massiliense]|uniref:SDR family oxidoreductase n=1 Tax=Numidum massiliense TaxID=1522315 RepID=UPI0006D5823D|nr:SDR family oxidoreductase [Numidum massiliense]